MDFHMIEFLVCYLFGSQIHFRMDLGDMYFWWTTLVHKLEDEINIQETLATKYLENLNMFLRPQPTRDFRIEIQSQWTHDITYCSLSPLQR